MDSLGVELKKARMRKGLSLEEVSELTRISVRRLGEIESDAFASIDSAFLYRSFAKQFAHCVGLDSAILNASLDAAASQIPEPLVPGQEGSPRTRPDLPALKPKRTHKLKWLLPIASLVVMLGACSTFYEFWESKRSTPDTEKAKAVTRPNPQSDAQGESRLSLPGSGPDLKIRLSALENTWLSLTADGREVFKGTLRTDESKILEGRHTAQVRTQNAGGVEVVFNGRPLGRLGPEGQIRTVVFTRDSYNILHSQLAVPLAGIIRAVE